MNVLLNIQNLAKSFGTNQVLKAASFAVMERSITLITGENGAGKTTLFNLLSGLEKPSSGNIYYNNENITRKTPLSIAKAGIARLYQSPRLFSSLSVWDNLFLAAPNPATATCEKIHSLLNYFQLQEYSQQAAGDLSYGQQKLIAFSMVALRQPKLLLLDEPFAGLSHPMINQLTQYILQLKEQGMTFIIIEHQFEKVLPIADRHFELADGHVSQIEQVTTWIQF